LKHYIPIPKLPGSFSIFLEFVVLSCCPEEQRNSAGRSLATETGLRCGGLLNSAVLQTGDRAFRNDGTNAVHTDPQGIHFEVVAAGNGLPVLDLGLPVFLVVFDEQLTVFREQALHAHIQAVEFRLDRIRRIQRG
jgi:hypothetical protein